MQELTSERGITITRVVRAPRQRVYDAFLDATHVGSWFGPDGFRTETAGMEPRVGGFWRFTMTGPDGTVYPNWVRYAELDPPSSIVWDHGAEDGEPAWFRLTVRFDEVPEGTHVTLQHQFPTAADRDRAVQETGAIEGGYQTLGRLAAYVESL